MARGVRNGLSVSSVSTYRHAVVLNQCQQAALIHQQSGSFDSSPPRIAQDRRSKLAISVPNFTMPYSVFSTGNMVRCAGPHLPHQNRHRFLVFTSVYITTTVRGPRARPCSLRFNSTHHDHLALRNVFPGMLYHSAPA